MSSTGAARCRSDSAVVRLAGERLVGPDAGGDSLPLRPLPERYLRWFEGGRLEMYAALGRGRHSPHFFAHHLPVLATRRRDGRFAANLGHKGVGPLPRPEHLQRYLDLYRNALEQGRNEAHRDRLQRALEAVRTLAADREAVDPRCFGTLEIFREQTYDNLCDHPFAALLFTGAGPEYLSFQLDCGVEIIGAGDPRYEFLVLARSLFEHEAFHITQPGFACGYVFWITAVHDKTPHPVGTPRPTP